MNIKKLIKVELISCSIGMITYMSGYIASLNIFKVDKEEAMFYGIMIGVVTTIISSIILSNKLTKEDEEQLNQRHYE
jgi:H+/gluconate symporter-like permease